MRIFQNLKLYYKIFTLIVLALVMLISVALVGYNYINDLAEDGESMYENNLKQIDSLGRIRTNLRANTAYIMELNITTDEETVKELQSQINERLEENEAEFDEMAKTDLDQKQTKLFNRLKEELTIYAPSRERMIELGVTNRNEEGYALFVANAREELRAVYDTLNEISDYTTASAESVNEANRKAATTAVLIMIAAVIIAIVLLTAIGIAIANLITRPVKRLQELMGRAENGDLTVTGDYNAKDEIGQLNRSFNGMLTGFKDTVTKILTAAESVSAAAQQISASTEEIASSSTDQAKSAQTMNELFTELSTAINSVADSAEHASELSDKTMKIAREGGAVVDTSIRGMDVLNQQMSKLEGDSNKIGEIIEVIDDIAEQTNLLALNAAIEAARAGDQGRGFAVVADEVRKLAERSGEATKQITSIIKGMQANTLESVKAVQDGVASSQKTGESFENIMTMVNESGLKVAEIAAASEQQAAQSSEVLQSIETISAATEEAASGSEETAASAQSLAQLAEELNATVSVFKIQ